MLLALLLVPALGALSALARSDAAAADTAARIGLSLTLLAALGRGVRIAFERRAGAPAADSGAHALGPGSAAFAPFGDPVLDALRGLLIATVGVFLLSFVTKRVLGLHAPIGPVVPIAMIVSALLLCAPSRVRRRALPKTAGILRLALFVAAFAWLAGDHLGARSAYSSDPDQHIAWLSQVRAFGLVPDRYLHTTAPVTYPQGFHAMLYALGAVTGLPSSSLVALAPPLASALFVYALVLAGRSLGARAHAGSQSAESAAGRAADGLLEALLVLALGAAFHSAQFSVWNVYEGTARLAAGLLHVIPVLALLAIGARPARSPAVLPAAATPWLLHAALPCTAFVLCALVFLLNPTHLPLQLLLFGVAIAARLWLDRGSRGLGRGLATGAACGAVIAAMMLSADPVGLGRWLERASPGSASREYGDASPTREDGVSAVARVEAEFDSGLAGRTCSELGCVVRAALSPRTFVGALLPLRTAIEGPFRALLEPRFDRRKVPLAPGPDNFPDWTGRGIAPLHGWTRLALVPLPLMFALVPALRRGRPLLVGLGLLALVCSLDAGARAALRVWVDPDDAALRLLPDYANRASAVVFAQSIGPLLVAGLAFGLRPGQSARLARVAVAVVLALVFFSAESELRGRQQELAHRRKGPSAADLRDLRSLELAHMPPGEHYLVASHVVESNRERWLLPVDASVSLYLQSERPSLFLYHLSSGARVSARDFEATCAALRGAARGVRPDLLEHYAARWVAVAAPTEARARGRFRAARFCGLPFASVFPDAALAAQRGRVALFRLW